jgi:hypothetical protein
LLNLAEVASTSANKAEPFMTEVITTSVGNCKFLRARGDARLTQVRENDASHIQANSLGNRTASKSVKTRQRVTHTK